MLLALMIAFIVVAVVWLLCLLGVIPGAERATPWLAFLAAVILGFVIFRIW